MLFESFHSRNRGGGFGYLGTGVLFFLLIQTNCDMIQYRTLNSVKLNEAINHRRRKADDKLKAQIVEVNLSNFDKAMSLMHDVDDLNKEIDYLLSLREMQQKLRNEG